MNYTSDIKDVKEYRYAKSIAYNLVLSIFITLALTVIAIYILGIRIDIVLSPSMSPTFYQHDVVIVLPRDNYNVGDIIEFRETTISKPVTHRIIEKTGEGKNAVYITKGDAVEKDTQTVKYSQVNGKVIDVIERGEYMYDFVKSNYFLLIDIILGVWVLSSTLNGEIEMRKHNIAKAE